MAAISYEIIKGKSAIVQGSYKVGSYSVTQAASDNGICDVTAFGITNALEPLVYEEFIANNFIGNLNIFDGGVYPNNIFDFFSNGSYEGTTEGFTKIGGGEVETSQTQTIVFGAGLVSPIVVTDENGNTQEVNSFYGIPTTLSKYELTTTTRTNGRTTRLTTSNFSFLTTSLDGTNVDMATSNVTVAAITTTNTQAIFVPTWKGITESATIHPVRDFVSTEVISFGNDYIATQNQLNILYWSFATRSQALAGFSVGWENKIEVESIEEAIINNEFPLLASKQPQNTTAFTDGKFIGLDTNGLPAIVDGGAKIVQKATVGNNVFSGVLQISGQNEITGAEKTTYASLINLNIANVGIRVPYTSSSIINILTSTDAVYVATTSFEDWGIQDFFVNTTGTYQPESQLVTSQRKLDDGVFLQPVVSAAQSVDIALKINSSQDGGGGYESDAIGQIFKSYTYNEMIAGSTTTERSGSKFTFSKGSYTIAFNGETSSNTFNTTGASTSQWETYNRGNAPMTVLGGKLAGAAIVRQGIYETYGENATGRSTANIPNQINWNDNAQMTGILTLKPYSTKTGVGPDVVSNTVITADVVEN